jgi:hypothetical protein
MPKPLRFTAIPLALLLSVGTVGCTLYSEKNPPTLATTTSAEQHDRILWQMAKSGQWAKISPLFSTTLVWSVDGKALSGEETLSYLKSLHLRDAVVRDAAVKPNGPDMTVTYTLQVSDMNGGLREFAAFSVWQQIKGGGYLLIAHSQQGLVAASTGAAGR